MNTNNQNAIELAEKIRQATELAERANRDGYNWDSLVNELAYLTSPEEVAKNLLLIHFEITNYLTSKTDIDPHPELGNALYYLRNLYSAILDMNQLGTGMLAITTTPAKASK